LASAFSVESPKWRVPEPVVPEPVAPEPVVPEPVAPEPVAPEPVVPEPVAGPREAPELLRSAEGRGSDKTSASSFRTTGSSDGSFSAAAATVRAEEAVKASLAKFFFQN
jgi:hypothetical protein